jgi:hypothetical protein
MSTVVLNPTQAKFKGLSFQLSNGKNYFIGLFSTDIPNYPKIVYPALLREDGSNNWTTLARLQELWDDIEEQMTADTYTSSIVNQFNAVLKKEGGLPADPADVDGDGEVSFVEKVARFLAVNVSVVDNQLVFKR